MKLYWFLLASIIPVIAALPSLIPPSSVTTGDLVEKHGYPFEEHEVQTSDGYILTMHRIPYSARVETPEPRPVAFLMHGILCSSSDWVLLGPGLGLAYLLSDAGYDVWMGNARGNTYSKRHATMIPYLPNFWNFDWHEIGMNDIPAMIDYALYETKQDQVSYIGHSQGTTTFLVLSSMNPKFKNRIRSAHLIAPVAFMDNMKSPIVKLGGPLFGNPNSWINIFGNTELMPNTRLLEQLGQQNCMDTSTYQALCSNMIFLFAGFDHDNLNTTLIPEILATTPAGASTNQIIHYAQEYVSGKFRQFDLGRGHRKPKDYPLDKIDVPIFLYYSENDYMASVVDVEKLMRKLKKKTLKRAYKVPDPNWNHLNFLWGLNIKEQVYNAVMEDIESMRYQ